MQLTDNTRRFIQIIDKIPMFHRLKPNQALEILRLCKPCAFSNREIVCEHGTHSAEMYILLSGELIVTAPDGTPLTKLSPVTIVGEMGLITGQPRSATVIAKGLSNVFEIPKLKFDILLKKYPEIGSVIYRNIIYILSQRLGENNKLLAASQRELANVRSQAAMEPSLEP
ncbi:MAG: cyclic nucleotide-binding domain-containing protein [bacterium]|nr:cyclic nucleotide-binding domain-containing protein [bacterium]